MAESRIVKLILKDMRQTIQELQKNNLVRDYRGISDREVGKNVYEISYPGKNAAANIVYSKHLSGEELMVKLLDGLQYTILMYDKSIIQAEFSVEENRVIKERLVFLKRHNRIWDMKEIQNYEKLEEGDWFSEEQGIPIMLRVDYAPTEHKECTHAASHLTLSNHETCRIPIKEPMTFSEFIKFVLFHFYNMKLGIKEFRFDMEESITNIEKKMIHMYWD